VAKLGSEAGTEGVKTASNLFQRMLGPAADEIGIALARKTAYRVGNLTRIVDGAAKKPGGDRPGQVPPRVAHRLLEEGSFCDDYVMTDYLSGVLAASRTPSGRDDRAVSWSDTVTGLSASQVRAHYLLYREWSDHLNAALDLNLGMSDGRQRAEMTVDLTAFAVALILDPATDLASALSHAVPGLVRQGLLEGDYGYGPAEGGEAFPTGGLRVRPSVAGLELYGWAMGVSDMTPHSFPGRALPIELEPPIPRLPVAFYQLTPGTPTP
jgi:hypothetical protein